MDTHIVAIVATAELNKKTQRYHLKDKKLLKRKLKPLITGGGFSFYLIQTYS